MVFQHFNLFPHLTVLENLTLGPVWVLKTPKAEAEARAMKYLERVRIPEQANKYPGQLSGGQQQRVAIARALAAKPSILMGDEPTGNLDTRTSREVIDLFLKLNQEHHLTVILVTHDLAVARHARRNVVLRDGRVLCDTLDHQQAATSLQRSQQWEVEAAEGAGPAAVEG